jgi:hypothetical protein
VRILTLDVFFSYNSFVRCQSRIDNFASKVYLPDSWTNIDTHHPNIPQLFIVNVQVEVICMIIFAFIPYCTVCVC